MYQKWPSYPISDHMFNYEMRQFELKKQDLWWAKYCKTHHDIELDIDFKDINCIGRLIISGLEYQKNPINHLEMYLHPYHCNKAHGSVLLNILKSWCFRLGINQIKQMY